MIPVTPPEGRPISSFLLPGSHERTSIASLEPPIAIVVEVPGVKSPTIDSTVSEMLYLYTLPVAPEDAAVSAASATNSGSLPEPGAGMTAI